IPEEHDAVVNDRSKFGHPCGVHTPGPGHGQVLDIVPIDLSEWAVTPGVVSPAPHQPVTRGRSAQVGVCDRGEAIERRSQRIESLLRRRIQAATERISYAWRSARGAEDGANLNGATADRNLSAQRRAIT